MNLKNTLSREKETIHAFLMERSETLFLVLYRAHADVLYRLALRLSGNDPDFAKDLAQETWATAIRRLDQFEHRSSFRTWITGILVNKWREHFREQPSWAGLDDENGTETHPMSQTIEPMDLERAIGRLADGYRAVLLLHDAEGYKHQEIAQILGIDEGTSKSQLSRARSQMRTYLKGQP